MFKSFTLGLGIEEAVSVDHARKKLRKTHVVVIKKNRLFSKITKMAIAKA